jgi:hypothetical protein
MAFLVAPVMAPVSTSFLTSSGMRCAASPVVATGEWLRPLAESAFRPEHATATATARHIPKP